MLETPSSLQLSLHASPARANELFHSHQLAIYQSTDRIFIWLMPLQWLASIIIASFVTAGDGVANQTRLWFVIGAGGLLTLPPSILALSYPGATITRYVIAVNQMLLSGFLAYLLKGHIETRFHFFGSLGFLAFYRDWRVLLLATLAAAADHLARDLFSLVPFNGIVTGSTWPWLFSVRWVILMDIFLFTYCLRATREMQQNAQHTVALESSEERFRALAEAAPDVILTINQSCDIIFINATAEKLLGYQPEELLGRPLTMLMPENQETAHWQGIKHWLATGQLHWTGAEIPVRHATGKTIPMELSCSYFKLNEEIFLAGILRDNSAHKEALALLKQSEYHSAVRAEINAALATPGVLLNDILRQVAEAIVEQLQARVVRIWTLGGKRLTDLETLTLQTEVNELGQVCEYPAPTPTGDAISRRVVKERQPCYVNNVQPDDLSAQLTAGLMSAAGFPLMIENRLIGVLTIFSCAPITPDAFDTLHMISEVIAQRVERQRIENALAQAAVELEARVQERTASLSLANESLKTEINERNRAEEELSKTQNFLHHVVNGVPNPIVVKNEAGKFHLVNAAFAQLYGQCPEAMQGKSDADFQPPEEAERLRQEDKEVLESQQGKLILEEKQTDFQGHVHWLQTVKLPLALGPDQPLLLLGISTDLTERKAMENQLRQAQKLEAIGQLAAGIAHEINTPMQFVGDNTRFVQAAFQDLGVVLEKMEELLQAVQPDAISAEFIAGVKQEIANADLAYLCEEIPKALEQSLDGVSRITSIVRSMKDFSHPGSHEKKDSDLNKAIASAVTVARNEWKYVADLETDFDAALPLVPCLLGEISQVILNLVINAAHAISDVTKKGAQGKGKITITTRTVGKQWAEIRIRDTGTGIPAHAREHIFAPFFTTKEVGLGTGQGLAISHTVIVEKHQGQLTFDTEMGQGTTFIIRLPLLDPVTRKHK